MSHFFDYCMWAVGIALAVQFGGIILYLIVMAFFGVCAVIANLFSRNN